MDPACDVLIIGGGIAGLSLASELAERRGIGAGIVLAETEPVLAHHTSGRSAEQLIPSYGPAPVRELTGATVARLLDPHPAPQRPLAWPLRRSAAGCAPPSCRMSEQPDNGDRGEVAGDDDQRGSGPEIVRCAALCTRAGGDAQQGKGGDRGGDET